jgi:ubiquinone/menaquinone biosynthesis C-methylase UbiE
MDDAAYLAENIDVVERNFAARQIYWNDFRFIMIRAFIAGIKPKPVNILSIGCGSYEPVLIGATHAVDIAPNAEKHLKELKWNGQFMVADCRKLPFMEKSFDFGVLSEVIEHLPTDGDVTLALEELERVCKNWLVSTPCNPLGPKNTEKTHRRSFTKDEIDSRFAGHNVLVNKDEKYWYIMKKHGN